MKRIETKGAPEAIGPYSQAQKASGLVYCSGQVALDPASGRMVEGGVARQTEQVIANLAAVLAAAGSSLSSIVKTTVYLARMADFGEMNEVYAEKMPGRPARATVAVAELPKGALVEIDAIALADPEG